MDEFEFTTAYNEITNEIAEMLPERTVLETGIWHTQAFWKILCESNHNIWVELIAIGNAWIVLEAAWSAPASIYIKELHKLVRIMPALENMIDIAARGFNVSNVYGSKCFT